jgi:site-specific DNA recombinase
MSAFDPKRTFAIAQESQISSRNLDVEFNSRRACEAYIKSQAHEGWRLAPAFSDDWGCRFGVARGFD